MGGAGAEEGLSPGIEGWLGVTVNTADTIAIGVVVQPLTYITVVIGELVPKTLALKHAVGFALRVAPWFSLSDKILGPLVTVLEWSMKQLLKVLTLGPKHRADAEVREPMEDMVELGHYRENIVNMLS